MAHIKGSSPPTMATPAANQATSVEENARNPTDIPRALAGQIHLIQSPPLLSTPLEMSRFEEHAPANDTPLVSSSPPTVISSDMDRSTREGQTQNTNFSTSASNSESQVQNPVGNTSTSPPASPKLSSPHPLTREKAIPAIGPSSDKPTLVPKESEINGPILMITLLLTNGARHPYKIDEKYLKKRSVNVEGNNPINMSTYTLKELIWREWREGRKPVLYMEQQSPC